MRLSNQTGLIRHSVALGMFLFGVGGPMYADTIVMGQVGENLGGTGSNLFSTQQTGSGVSDTLLPWNFTCTTCSGYGITASGAAAVDNGTLRATGTISVTGAPASPFLTDVSSDALYSDMLTITGGATGTHGVLELTYALDGMISSTGSGNNTSELNFTNFAATTFQFDNEGIESGASAVAFGNGTHNDTVIFYIPFTYGTPFTNELDLSADPSFILGFFGDNDQAPFTATVNYYNTASLNSALVFNGTASAPGTQNTSAVISSDSGLGYGPNGISAVPEPHSWFLLVSVIGVLALVKRRAASRPTV